MAKVSWIKRKRKEHAKPSSRSLDLLPCPVCHELPNLRFWGDSDYYFECHIARKPLAPQEHFPTVQEAANDWNKDVRYIKKILQDVDAVPVVRCKDCRYWGDEAGVTVRTDGVMFARCKVHNLCVSGKNIGWCPTEDDFCSLGERRGDNGSASMSDN